MDFYGVCGEFTNRCAEKFHKAWNEGTKLGKAKAVGYGLLSGVPDGLAVCGIMLFGLGIAARMNGKIIGFVSKKE